MGEDWPKRGGIFGDGLLPLSMNGVHGTGKGEVLILKLFVDSQLVRYSYW